MFLSLEDENEFTPIGLCHKVICMNMDQVIRLVRMSM
jgi:hypothetical protein